MEEQKFNKVQMIALVLMRVTIGWHFLYEGVAKYLKPNWSAAGYLMQARGILAPIFKWMVDTPSVLSIVNVMNMKNVKILSLLRLISR